MKALPGSFRFQKGFTQTPSPKTLRGDRFCRKGPYWSLPDPVGPGVQVTCPKITFNEVGWPLKFGHNLSPGSKVIYFEAVTDRQAGRRAGGQAGSQEDKQTHILTSWHLNYSHYSWSMTLCIFEVFHLVLRTILWNLNLSRAADLSLWKGYLHFAW